jgi:aryl-alcohol dehydrogenase-like predicted oxidoreductase
MGRYRTSAADTATREYAAIAARHGLTPTQLALAWVASRWFVASTIIGATSLPQLRENLGAFAVELPQSAVDEVNAVHRRMRDPPLAA